MSKSNKNILLIMTGSIACYKACGVVSALHQKGYAVKVVLSPSSLQFIGAATIEGLTGETPITDMYAAGSVMDHIHLARWADLILVAPATANYINKIANGLGDDLLTTLFLAHDFKKPFLVAPAMNTMMYLHPTTQDSIGKLKKFGVGILETASGVLACGEVGYGRLLDPVLIVQEVESHLQKSGAVIESAPLKNEIKNIKVLVTSGGTTEPIDDVRVITNTSTGKTAAYIAEQLAEAGLEVDYLHAINAALPKADVQKYEFLTFKDLQNQFENLLTANNYDWVIHTAAVSDYSVDKTSGKISNDADQIHLVLKRNPKLLNQIKELSPSTKLVGFKLTSSANGETILEKVSQQFKNASCELVVHNDLSEISKTAHPFHVYSSSMKEETAKNTQELSLTLLKKIIEARSL
ncbi:MAG: bifunctional phosphopantothenoylcysteine decarboxylase/phosphopantothenate--cysteine ligase CoaBC [Bdellovibrio sp.]|nr:bifunctional phosphopantothenoylcysteine decarboxylase/phosphopantothenate--cysteine ligase CoaBC [Bdellovibrio sp.]